MLKRLAERELRTKFGVFREFLYYDGQKESIAIVMGDVAGRTDVLCRIHSHCIGAHVFNSVECTCREEMAAAQATIQNEGRGVIIWLDQEGKGNGHLALIESIPYKKAGLSQGEAYKEAGFLPDARRFDAAYQILTDLGINSITLLTDSAGKAESIRNARINVSGTRKLDISGSNKEY
jgi:GTP cyclohydrolase II